VLRAGSEKKLPADVSAVIADPLKEGSYTESVRGCDTSIHLIGVPHPSPAKAAQFRAIDLPSVKVAVKAAVDAGVRHFIISASRSRRR
jgi:nucleoside-diphosphate-sugar epimerase